MGQPAYDMSSEVRRRKAPQTQRKVALRVEKGGKRRLRRWSTACTCPPEFPVCVCGGKAKAKLITRKPIEADKQELEENRRSRSAHLRVLEKL